MLSPRRMILKSIRTQDLHQFIMTLKGGRETTRLLTCEEVPAVLESDILGIGTGRLGRNASPSSLIWVVDVWALIWMFNKLADFLCIPDKIFKGSGYVCCTSKLAQDIKRNTCTTIVRFLHLIKPYITAYTSSVVFMKYKSSLKIQESHCVTWMLHAETRQEINNWKGRAVVLYRQKLLERVIIFKVCSIAQDSDRVVSG